MEKKEKEELLKMSCIYMAGTFSSRGNEPVPAHKLEGTYNKKTFLSVPIFSKEYCQFSEVY